MDTDINISEDLCLSKVTVSNMWVKNNSITIYTTIKIFPRAEKNYSVGELDYTQVGCLPSIK